MLYIPRKRLFWAVGLGHLTNDIFMASGVVLLAFLSATVLPMSNTQIGFAISAAQLSGAITQPGFGVWADRRGGRWLGAGGLAWVVSMYMLAVVAAIVTRNYWLMLIPFVLRGIGSGAVHPVGALHAAEVDRERVASHTAFFFLMGQAGLAIGPALLGLILDLSNLDLLRAYADVVGLPGIAQFAPNLLPVFVLTVLALPGVALMATTIPVYRRGKNKATDKAAQATDTADARSTSARVSLPMMAFAVLAVMVILRSLATPGSVNFIPVLFQQKGWSPSEYGLITSLFWLASGISGVFFGGLADRYDRRLVMMFSMVLSAPAFFFLPILDGTPAFLLAIVAGGFVGGAHSIIVVLAQSLLPDSKGFASGAILGFIFGAGAIGSLVIGSVSDSIGLAATFQLVAVAVALAGVLGLLLPKAE
jgi:MFS transporter, FSR family, fosmidomycin resistance protein